jgi:serine/threonine protein kinase
LEDTKCIKWFIGRMPDTRLKNNIGKTAEQLATDPVIVSLLKNNLKTMKIGSPRALPERLGPSGFRVLELLGRGSFGEVYLVNKIDTN